MQGVEEQQWCTVMRGVIPLSSCRPVHVIVALITSAVGSETLSVILPELSSAVCGRCLCLAVLTHARPNRLTQPQRRRLIQKQSLRVWDWRGWELLRRSFSGFDNFASAGCGFYPPGCLIRGFPELERVCGWSNLTNCGVFDVLSCLVYCRSNVLLQQTRRALRSVYHSVSVSFRDFLVDRK